MSAAAYRARSATELIDATFQILRRNAAAFFTLALMFTILNTIISILFVRPALGQPQTLGAATPSLGGTLMYLLGVMALGAVFHTAMMIAASESYLGKPVVVGDDLKQAFPKVLTLFVAYVLSSFLVGISVIGFIVGSFYVALVLFAVPAVIIFENADIGKAISRSSALSKGLKGHILLTFVLAAVIILVGYFIIFFVSSLFLTINATAQLIVQTLLTTLIVPVYPIVAVLVYYDARIRKEGFDIELMAQQVESAAAATTKPQPA